MQQSFDVKQIFDVKKFFDVKRYICGTGLEFMLSCGASEQIAKKQIALTKTTNCNGNSFAQFWFGKMQTNCSPWMQFFLHKRTKLCWGSF